MAWKLRCLDTKRLQLGLLGIVIGTAPFSIAISQSALALAILLRLGALRRRPPRTGLEAPLLLWLGWILITLPAATDPGESFHHLRRWLLLPALWLFAEAGAEASARRILFASLTLGSTGVAVYGLMQGFGVLSVDPEFVAMGKIPLTTNPMTAGALMMMASLTLLPFSLSGGLRTRLPAALVFLLSLWALLLIEARAAWLGFIAGAFVMLLMKRPRWAWLLPALLVLAMFAGPERYRERFVSAFRPGIEYKSNWQRRYMWKTGWMILKDHPVTGLGDRDLYEHYSMYTPEEDREHVVLYGHLHSNPVMFAVLWGIPGLVLALVCLTAVPMLQWRRRRDLLAMKGRAPPLTEAWTLGALAAWTGFLVAGLFEWYFGDAEVILLAWALAGLSLAPLETADEDARA